MLSSAVLQNAAKTQLSFQITDRRLVVGTQMLDLLLLKLFIRLLFSQQIRVTSDFGSTKQEIHENRVRLLDDNDPHTLVMGVKKFKQIANFPQATMQY